MASEASRAGAGVVDATFREPPSADPAFYVFNTASNWLGGIVPTGTATIASAKSWPPITFSAAVTTLEAINVTGQLPMQVAARQRVEANKAGLMLTCSDLTLVGDLNANVVLKHAIFEGRDYAASVSGPGGGPAGTIFGDVASPNGLVSPGGNNGGGVGTLNIAGSYVQGHSDPANPIVAMLQIGSDGTGVSRLNVTGRAQLVDKCALVIQVNSGDVPLGKKITVLSAKAGLNGVFKYVEAFPQEYTATPDYDDNNAYVTLTRS